MWVWEERISTTVFYEQLARENFRLFHFRALFEHAFYGTIAWMGCFVCILYFIEFLSVHKAMIEDWSTTSVLLAINHEVFLRLDREEQSSVSFDVESVSGVKRKLYKSFVLVWYASFRSFCRFLWSACAINQANYCQWDERNRCVSSKQKLQFSKKANAILLFHELSGSF